MAKKRLPNEEWKGPARRLREVVNDTSEEPFDKLDPTDLELGAAAAEVFAGEPLVRYCTNHGVSVACSLSSCGGTGLTCRVVLLYAAPEIEDV